MLKYLILLFNSFSLVAAQVPVTHPVDVAKDKKFVVEMTDSHGEEAFKRLHELKGGSLPELLGSMVKTSAGPAYLSVPPS